VIITIIAALLALTASAVVKYILVQQTSNTQTTETKVQSLLSRQVSAVKDKANKEAIDPVVDDFIRKNLAGGANNPNLDRLVRVIYVKLKMRQMFPQNFAEALNLPYNNPQLANLGIATAVQQSPLHANPVYIAYLNKFGINGNTLPYISADGNGGSGTYSPQPYESSACLLMALQGAQSGGGANVGDIGGGGSSLDYLLFMSDPQKKNPPTMLSVPLFVDAWKAPLYFTRVPAGCAKVNDNPTVPGGGKLGAHDTFDPEGHLNSNYWIQGNHPNTTTFSQLTLQPLAAGNSSYNLPPMIASGGQDKKLSDFTWFTTSQVYDNDNLYSSP
jgi:hypothetical protein